MYGPTMNYSNWDQNGIRTIHDWDKRSTNYKVNLGRGELYFLIMNSVFDAQPEVQKSLSRQIREEGFDQPY